MSSLERWHSEKQSAWLYRVVADREEDETKSRMFRALAVAAEEQADILLGDLRKEGRPEPRFEPSTRARFMAFLTRRVGPRRVQPMLAALKVRGLSVYRGPATVGHPMPVSSADLGERHRSAGRGGSLRAAVFGLNDGLVSNTCLILGVSGASDSSSLILATGIAGLLAGAFSMGAGEWVSVRSQRELYERQIGEEREELDRYPEEEAEELALIYNARGVPMEEARAVAKRVLQDPEQALATLSREELGLNPDDLGSPWRAAISSFAAFAMGALIPLVPFFFDATRNGIVLAVLLSALALLAVGGLLSLFSGRSFWLGSLRMLAIGAAAGGATYGIGRWIGVSV
jgi:VIT1/CCC1 family predicted Fe2+/Mn2+ transporter